MQAMRFSKGKRQTSTRKLRTKAVVGKLKKPMLDCKWFCPIHLLMLTNIPIPMTSGVQKTANQVNAAIEKVNKSSLASIQDDLKVVNVFKGRLKDTKVKMEGDYQLALQ